MEKEKLSLFEKIQLVSNEINNLEKDMSVGTGSYSYKAVSDLQVTLAVKKAETKYRLVSIPLKQELLNSETLKTIRKDGNESITYVDTIKMTVKIFDLDSKDFIEIESLGKGIDSGDKGFGKASTYARKYALLNAYKIATGEDPDSEKSQETLTPKTISDKRKAVTDYLNNTADTLTQSLLHFNVSDPSDFTDENIEVMFNAFKSKKRI
jgi:hypothetical protein